MNDTRPGLEPVTLADLREIARGWTPGVVLGRLVVISALWFILTEAELRYWGLVLVAIVTATLVSLVLMPTSGLRWSPVGWLRFIPFFLIQSVLGGVDVTLRALAFRPRLDPTYLEYRLRLDSEPARVLVANTMSLMPGSLSVSLEGSHLRMHVLDRGMSTIEIVQAVEEHSARMFRLDLTD